MIRILIAAKESQTQAGLYTCLTRNGFNCSSATYNNGLRASITRQPPDLLLVEMDEQQPTPELWELIKQIKRERPLPVIALIPEEKLDSIDGCLDIDDFLTSPHDAKELVLRIKRLLHRSKNMDSHELIKRNGLMIDLAKCEVTVEGRIVELTFKEYELLKLLAGNPGRVYTRESLLNRVWGYDYYGGDRTVDVHVRRLRSKIEDANHAYIETVRNIGYRFQVET